VVHWRIWEEEIRSFPWGGDGASVWVVRRESQEDWTPLRLLFSYHWGDVTNGPAGSATDQSQRLPLGHLLRAIQSGESGLFPWRAAKTTDALKRKSPAAKSEMTSVSRLDEIRVRELMLWVEPLRSEDQVQGALALLFDGRPPWGEAVRLWCARFSARISPLLGILPILTRKMAIARSEDLAEEQPTLFPVSPFRSAASLELARSSDKRGLTLPRPVFVRDVPGAVGISREFLTCCSQVQPIAESGVNALLQGESGTGKEIIARAIHCNSPRRQGPFVGQNCAALPETLFESELFGHKSGAFTGASSDKMGLLEAADGGTFFLDEIGDMPIPLQIKLLRVMQERRVRRIGELESRRVDIRFVAATHRDLEREVQAGNFRLDLFYRLKVVKIAIPSLRQRPEDIVHLLAFFLHRHGRGQARMRITEQALAALQAYRWPGNVRELENEACRLLALHSERDVIELELLSGEIQAAAGWSVDPADLATLRPLDEANQLLERYLIRKAIVASGGRKAAAARRLGLSRQGLYKKIQRYGMTDLIHSGGEYPVDIPHAASSLASRSA
jgi:DNA-binding NtrC family response regulator